jgi:arylsulfatase I/J
MILLGNGNLVSQFAPEILNTHPTHGRVDNGGWITTNKLGGNNYPLRGGKVMRNASRLACLTGGEFSCRCGRFSFPYPPTQVSDFEGGVRVNAFLTGGYLPESLRGKNTSSLIHVTDWWGN